jgi:hypothetical protein
MQETTPDDYARRLRPDTATVGMAAVGSLVLGPVGLVGGALAGGNKKRIMFTLTLKDGRRMLATADGKTWTKLQSALF